METIKKINVDGIEYSVGEDIKVADLKVTIDEDGYYTIDFVNCPAIDFYKGIKIEMIDTQNNKHFFNFKGYDFYEPQSENLIWQRCTVFTENLEEPADLISYVNDTGEHISSLTLNNGLYDEKEFYICLSPELYQVASAKIYYYEANETTQYFYCTY